MKLIFWRLLPRSTDGEAVHVVECDSYRESDFGVQLFRRVEIVRQPTVDPAPGSFTEVTKPRRPRWWNFFLPADPLDEAVMQSARAMLRAQREPAYYHEHFMTVRSRSFDHFEIEYPAKAASSADEATGPAGAAS